MNSSLYECDVMHYRLEPKKNRFVYKLFHVLTRFG